MLIEGDVDGNSSGEGAASGGVGAASGGTGAASGGTGAASGGTGAASGGTGAASGGTGASGGGKAQWAKAVGTDGHQHLRALTTDLEGNVIVAGYFDGVIDLGAGAIAQTGVRSAFVIKLDASGHVVWSQTFTADDCAAEAISVTAENGVMVTGFVRGSLHVGDESIPGGDGIFVTRLDEHGALLWAHTYGSSAGMQADRGLSITTSPLTGGPIVSGSFTGSLDIGGPLSSPAGVLSVFVAGLSLDGAGVWSTALLGTTGVVAAGPEGHAVVATGDGGATMRVFDLDEMGVITWSHQYGPGSFNAVAVDGAGNALLVGSTTSADFGGGPLPSPLPNGEGFLLSLDPAGKHRYTRGLPFDTTQSSAVALTVDAAGAVAVTGSYVLHVDSSTVIQSAFLATFDKAGAKQKSQTFGPTAGLGGAVTQEGWGLAPAPAGGLYLGGDFYTAIDVAGKSLTGAGTSDVFVARLAP